MLRHSIAALLLATLPALAQRTEQPAPPPILRVLSRDLAMLHRLAAQFGAEPKELKLASDEQCGELVVQEDLRTEQRISSVAPRAGNYSEIMLRPGGLVTAFAKEIAAEKAGLAVQLGFVLQQAGFPAGLGAELIDDAILLLPQIGGLYVEIEGDPRHPGKGLGLRLELTPQPGSDLQRYFAMLSPNAAGVPALPGDSRLDLRLSLNADLLHNLTQPFAAIAAQYGAANRQEQLQQADYLDRLLQAWDGTFASRFDDQHLLTVLGLRDAAAYRAALLAPANLERQLQSARRRRLDLEFTPNALVHRETPLLKTESSTAATNPLLPGGELTSYSGVANGLAFTVGGASIDAAAAKAVVDDALDGRFARTPLQDLDRGRKTTALVRLDLSLDRLPGVEDLLADAAEDARPTRAHLLIHKVGITLKITLELQ